MFSLLTAHVDILVLRNAVLFFLSDIWLPPLSLPQALRDLAKQSGERVSNGLRRLDRWLKSTADKEEFYKQIKAQETEASHC